MQHASPLPLGATEKRCSKCGDIKPLSEFYVRKDPNTRGYSSQCRACDLARNAERRTHPEYMRYLRERNAQWQRDNRERSNALTAAWRRRDPRKLSVLKRKWRYGLATEQFEQLLSLQDYRCAICTKPFDSNAGIDAIHVDHDHESSRVRGLLCGRCNRGIGHFHDRPDLLRCAADYLETQMKTWSDLGGNAERLAEQETTSPTA